MYNSKLLKLFKSFSPEEWKAFGLFLQSPYHNTSEQALLLYRYLENCFPEFSPEQVDRKKLYRVIYPVAEEYVDRRLRDLFSNMGKLAQAFLAVEQLKKDAILKERLTITALREHQHYEKAHKQSDTLVKKLEKASKKNLKDYALQHWLNYDRYFDSRSVTQSNLVIHLKKAYHTADDFYYLSKLRCVCEFLARAFQIREDQPFEKEIIKKLLDDSEGLESKNLLLKCYRHLVMVFREKGRYGWPFYQELKKVFFTHWQALPDLEVQIFYKHMYNYLVYMTRQNEELYEPEKLILYRFAIEKNLLIYDNKLSPYTFGNISFIGSKVGEFSWTKSFIKKYKQYLPSENRDEVVDLSGAGLAFYQKEYLRAQELITPIFFKDVNFELARRSLLLRIFFEQYAIERAKDTSLLSHADTFNHFLSRKAIINDAKARPYRNLIRFTINLYKLVNLNSPARAEKLRRKVEACERLAFKSWVKEHLKKLAPDQG